MTCRHCCLLSLFVCCIYLPPHRQPMRGKEMHSLPTFVSTEQEAKKGRSRSDIFIPNLNSPSIHIVFQPRNRKRQNACPIEVLDLFVPNDGDVEVVGGNQGNHQSLDVPEYRLSETIIRLDFIAACHR
jgi:hypothetical protein